MEVKVPPPGIAKVIERIAQIEKRFRAPKTAEEFKNQLESALKAREADFSTSTQTAAPTAEAETPMPQVSPLMLPNQLGWASSGEEMEAAISQAARLYGMDENLIRAVIQAESAGNPEAVSSKGAQGLMQLMPGTAAELGVENSFDVQQNVLGGSKYLRGLLDQYDGDVERALAAYNAGPGAVERYNGIPPYQETQEYVNRVLDFYHNGF